MKFLILSIALLCTTYTAMAAERIFDCTPVKINKIKEIPEEFNLLLKPKFIYRQSEKDWSIQVASHFTRFNDNMGPAMIVDSEVSPDNTLVSYYFQLDGSLEFQFSIRTDDHSAILYWWGLGEATPMATMQCEVIEQ